MVELTKKQVSAIKAVGKVSGASPSIAQIVRYVFSDGLNVYGTNEHVLLIKREIGAPKWAYFQNSSETADGIVFAAMMTMFLAFILD